MTEQHAHAIGQLTLELAEVRASIDRQTALLKGIQERLSPMLQTRAPRHVVEDGAGVHVAQD